MSIVDRLLKRMDKATPMRLFCIFYLLGITYLVAMTTYLAGTHGIVEYHAAIAASSLEVLLYVLLCDAILPKAG